MKKAVSKGSPCSPGLPSVSSLGSLDLIEGPTMENLRKNMDLLLFLEGPETGEGLEKGPLALLAFLP